MAVSELGSWLAYLTLTISRAGARAQVISIVWRRIKRRACLVGATLSPSSLVVIQIVMTRTACRVQRPLNLTRMRQEREREVLWKNLRTSILAGKLVESVVTCSVVATRRL